MMMAPPGNPGSAVDADAIPEGLQERDKWVCWRYEGQGKVPISPRNPGDGRISALDPINWADLETAYQTGKDHGEVDGIGFVFNTDAPIMGVDLDHCRVPKTGTIQTWARGVIDTLDSYTEVSPSGTGVHVYVKADLPDGGNRSGEVEMYEGKRFFTVTGQHVEDTPKTICEAQQAVETVHDEWIADSRDNGGNGGGQQTSATEGVGLPDCELIEKAKNANDTGEKFSRLWRGDYSHQPSHSEARLELYNYLAFWTGKDQQRIWRLFQQSGLYPHPEMPGKCERLKDREIQKAIQDTRNSYDPDYHVDNDKLPNKSPQTTADGGRLSVSNATVVAVVEALEELGDVCTSELAEYPGIGCSERQVRRALNHLDEEGTIEWIRDGRSTLAKLVESSDV